MSWRVVGASVVGTSHLRASRGCDDAHEYRLLPNGTLLLAVADGASSADRSAEGAQLVLTRVLDRCEDSLAQTLPVSDDDWTGFFRARLQDARAVLEDAVAGPDDPLSLQQLATTLTLVAVTDSLVASCQVGDGAVVARLGEDQVNALIAPTRNEYLNETTFITSSDYLERAACVCLPRSGITGIAVMTDGIQAIAFDLSSGVPHPPFFHPLFRFAEGETSTQEELAGFLASERVCDVTDDDKTIILAVPE